MLRHLINTWYETFWMLRLVKDKFFQVFYISRGKFIHWFLTRKYSQYDTLLIKNVYSISVLNFNLGLDQHEPGNNFHIPVDTPPKLNVHKLFLWCRNINKLLNGQNVHFRIKSHTKKQINEHEDLFKRLQRNLNP